jgi:hypothetical protein
MRHSQLQVSRGFKKQEEEREARRFWRGEEKEKEGRSIDMMKRIVGWRGSLS